MERGYVLKTPFSVRRVVEGVSIGGFGFLTFLGMHTFAGDRVGATAWLVGAAGVAFGVRQGLRRHAVVRVDDDGVRFGGVEVPWASVWHLVLLRPEPVAGAFRTDLPPQVGVRLRSGAPLPKGVRGLVTDPNDPLAIPEELRSSVSQPEIDGAALLAAARVCAPPDVVLVERVGDEEHVLPR